MTIDPPEPPDQDAIDEAKRLQEEREAYAEDHKDDHLGE